MGQILICILLSLYIILALYIFYTTHKTYKHDKAFWVKMNNIADSQKRTSINLENITNIVNNLEENNERKNKNL